ncbi:MAG: hypothetical protein Q9227_003024 [Pyrenula ochraceoflavens]
MISTTQQTPFPNPAFKPRPSTGRPSTGKNGEKKNIWNSMLDDVATTKGLPEKQLIVLDQQREFLDLLNPESSKPPKFTRDHHHHRNSSNRKPNTPPISNRYALGYTYQDILDADQDDILARLSIYTLHTPSPTFTPFLSRLFTRASIPNTLIAILLDWANPWKWPRQLRQWIRLLRAALITLDDEVKVAMEENVTEWREKRKGGGGGGGGEGSAVPPPPSAAGGGSGGGEAERMTQQQKSTAATNAPVQHTTPPVVGPGEWDEGLGVPLCFVCHNAEKIERLEKDFGWEEGEFDFIAQWMRTVLLKHGGSIIYSSSFDPGPVQLLINSSLGIHSLLQREKVKYNIVDRDKMLIPPNWDSWAKIRILNDEFDLEGLSNAWSVEIQDPPEEISATDLNNIHSKDSDQDQDQDQQKLLQAPPPDPSTSAVAIFEATLPTPSEASSSSTTTQPNPLSATPNEVTCPDIQAFLQTQAEVLEKLKADDEKEALRFKKNARPDEYEGEMTREADEAKIAEQIGPVQFNVGGIQVDADEAVRGLKEREADRAPQETTMAKPTGDATAVAPGPSANNETLANFFAGLMQKGKGAGVSREGTPGPP